MNIERYLEEKRKEEKMEEKMEEKLREIFGYINMWLHYAEAKNGAILAMSGAIILGLSNYEKSLHIWIYLGLNFILVLSFISALLSFFPNLSNSKIHNVSKFFLKVSEVFDKKDSRNFPPIKLFYKDIAEKYKSNDDDSLPKEYVVDLYKDYFNKVKDKSEISKLEEDYSKEIIINSKITLNKYILFKSSLVFLIIFLFLFFISIAGSKLFFKNEREVIQNKLILRNLPDIHSEKLGVLDKNEKVEIIKEKNNWAKIKVSNKEGWVYKVYLD